MRKLIFILLAFISVATYGQTKQTIKQLTVNDSLTIKAGNPAANKIAVSVDGNGRFRWVYFSDFQDSINTGVYDTLNTNILNTNTVKVNRDSFTDPAATIASIGDSGFIVQCAASCDDIRWTTIDGTQTVLKDITDNVGIGTDAPNSKLEITGTYYQQVDSSGTQNIISSGKPISTSFFSYYNGIALLSSENTQAQLFVVSDTGVIIGTNGAMSDGLLSVRGDNTLRIFDIKATGNIGINTETPTEKLHVAGTSLFTDTLTYTNGTQADGYILTSDATGNATWQDPNAYGEMGFGDSLRTIAITQNVFSVVTNSNNTLWSTAAIDLHNVTYSGDSLIIDSAGVYQVNVQLSMDGTSGSVIRLGVFLNGVLACSCTGYQELLNNRILQLTYINIDALNAGDVLQVVITNTANGDDVDAIGGKLMVNKIR